MLLENGANMKDVQQILGHSKLATTMDTYAHVTTKMSKNSVDIFEKINKKIGDCEKKSVNYKLLQLSMIK